MQAITVSQEEAIVRGADIELAAFCKAPMIVHLTSLTVPIIRSYILRISYSCHNLSPFSEELSEHFLHQSNCVSIIKRAPRYLTFSHNILLAFCDKLVTTPDSERSSSGVVAA